MTTDIASVSLPDGERIPKLGQGTWEMGEQPARRARNSPRCAAASNSA